MTEWLSTNTENNWIIICRLFYECCSLWYWLFN